MDNDLAKILNDNVIKRIQEIYPDTDSLARQIAIAAAQISVITLQEYEKLKTNNK